MAWVRVDDKMARGPKVNRAAMALGGKFPRRRVLAVWLQAMSYCNLYTTDGFFPDFELSNIEDERPVEVFTAMSVGDSSLGAIVERDDARLGWVFRNYTEYQPSRASLQERAEIDRKRKAEYRASKARPSVVRECPTGTETDGAKTSVSPGPDRTDPAPKESRRADRSRQKDRDTAEPEWRVSHAKVPTLVEPRRNHASCYDVPVACARGLCVPGFLGRQWEAQLKAGQSDTFAAGSALCGRLSAIAEAWPAGQGVGDLLPWWRDQWEARYPSASPKTKGNRTVAAGQRLQAALDAGAELDPFGTLADERDRQKRLGGAS